VPQVFATGAPLQVGRVVVQLVSVLVIYFLFTSWIRNEKLSHKTVNLDGFGLTVKTEIDHWVAFLGKGLF
jgi:hypothetical protein